MDLTPHSILGGTFYMAVAVIMAIAGIYWLIEWVTT